MTVVPEAGTEMVAVVPVTNTLVMYVDTDPGNVVGIELPLSSTVVVCGNMVVVTVTKFVEPGSVTVYADPETVKVGGTIVSVIVVPGPTTVSPGAVIVDAGTTTVVPGAVIVVSDPESEVVYVKAGMVE